MDWLWHRLKRIFSVVFSYVIAICRLIIWTILFFFSGLQRTLFMRSEVASVDFKVLPLRCDMEDTDEKLAYLDKLCLENPDLMQVVEEEIVEDSEDEDDGEDEQ